MRSPRRRVCPTCAQPDLPRIRPVQHSTVHAPYKADLALTYGCNNACPHCYNEPRPLSHGLAAQEAVVRVIDRAAREWACPHLILTGGEATLHPDLTRDHPLRRPAGPHRRPEHQRPAARPPALHARTGRRGPQPRPGHLWLEPAELHDAINGATLLRPDRARHRERPGDSPLHTITNTTLMRAATWTTPRRSSTFSTPRHPHLRHERHDLLRRRVCANPDGDPRGTRCPPS
jgi:hypothetical protein